MACVEALPQFGWVLGIQCDERAGRAEGSVRGGHRLSGQTRPQQGTGLRDRFPFFSSASPL